MVRLSGKIFAQTAYDVSSAEILEWVTKATELCVKYPEIHFRCIYHPEISRIDFYSRSEKYGTFELPELTKIMRFKYE